MLMYVCMHACMHACIYMYIYIIQAHTCLSQPSHDVSVWYCYFDMCIRKVCIYVHMHLCLNIDICLGTYLYKHVHTSMDSCCFCVYTLTYNGHVFVCSLFNISISIHLLSCVFVYLCICIFICL